MNSTPKERVQRLFPQAYAAGGGGAWTIYALRTPLGEPSQVLGRGSKPGRAWLNASQRLVSGLARLPERTTKVQSLRGF